MMTQYAKKVKNLIEELGICVTIDRTKEKHSYPFDIDVRVSSSPRGRAWIYWGSQRSIKACRNVIREYLKVNLGHDAQARIVEAKTGRILEVIRRGG
jgi:hypothetical protein